MTTAALFARLLLFLVFGLAGAAKIRDRDAARRAAGDLGLGRLARPVAVVLPAAELGVAAGLLVPGAGRYAAVACLALLTAFTALIAANLVRGRRVHCHCFGGSSSRPIGWRSLARNAALATMAGAVLASPSAPWSSIPPVLGAATSTRALVGATFVAVLVGIGTQWWLSAQTVRQQGRMLIRLDALEARITALTTAEAAEAAPRPHESSPLPQRGLPVGSPIPGFRLPDANGQIADAAALRGAKLLLVNWNPGCGFCDMVAPDLAGARDGLHARGIRMVLLAYGSAEDNLSTAREHGIDATILLQEPSPVELFERLGTPSAYLVDEHGRVAAPLAVGLDEVRTLAAGAAQGRWAAAKARPGRPVVGLPAGAVAPDFLLPNLDGAMVGLAGLHRSRTILVFTDPQCGPCQQVAGRLADLDSRLATSGVDVVVIGRGDPAANREKAREQGLRLPYLVDRKMKVARQYEQLGTPSASLIGPDGRIAASVAGLDAVAALVSDTLVESETSRA